MAKKALRSYTFTPGIANNTVIVVDGYWPVESFLLITNTTIGAIIYNFADPTLGIVSHQYNSTTNKTQINLEADTSSQGSSHKLQIFVDDWRGSDMLPSESYQDPVSKLRVSTPQAIIDTDFEYSVQPSKWESLSLVRNRPSTYATGSGASAFDVISMSGNGSFPRSFVFVTTTTAHNLIAGDVVVVQDALESNADGTYTVQFIFSSTQFAYQARGFVSSASVFDSGFTTVYAGGAYRGANIQLLNSTTAVQYSGTTITVFTSQPHNLVPGTSIILGNIATNGSNAPNGTWVVDNVPSIDRFSFQVSQGPSGVLSSGVNFQSAILYAISDGYVQHRATDGGVLITPGSIANGAQQIRQTRRYFRYQSGKGIQFSTGAKFTPTFDVSTISASGTTITVTTLQDHNLQVGSVVKIEGVVSSAGDVDSARYNLSLTFVTAVTGPKTFTYSALSAPTDTLPGGTNVFATAVLWSGASVRVGLYDDQNGFFFEYDGNQLYACRRQSIKELFGRIAVSPLSCYVSGTSTRFREQLVVGDHIIIKGQSYQISSIIDDTQLMISPAYRGELFASNVKYLKTVTTRIPQSQWNLDKMNGTGPSGYNIDISKMQMAYIDYTWYGAGFIRFGFRAISGDIIYCHKISNNNINTAAYQRSGNLPARFEAINSVAEPTRVVAGGVATRGSTLFSSDTTMYVENVDNWPTSNGYILVGDATNLELIAYSFIGAYNSTVRGYPLNGLTRRFGFNIAGTTTFGGWSTAAYFIRATQTTVNFSPDTTLGGSGTSQVHARLFYCNCAPVVSHWGVSVIMDGRYDDDKALIFTAGMNRYLSVSAGTQRPLIAIRIAPSVDSGIGRNWSIRELVNRMQLTLESVEVFSQGQFLIEGILNPFFTSGGFANFPSSWTATPVGSGSLAQVYYFDLTGSYSSSAATGTGSIFGGDRIFGFFSENSGGTNFSTSRIDLKNVRDLGNSIISGPGGVGGINIGFPAGPDVLVITARLLEPSGTKNIAARISWTEAQA
jgi:hypothetical protein